MKTRSTTVTGLTLLMMLASGCATAPHTDSDRARLVRHADHTIATFKETDPSMERFFEEAYAFAVFPSIGKGAAGLGGAYGRGVAYENGRPVGFCDLSQATVGIQFGGQSYSQIIFFQTGYPFEQFRSGTFAFSAQASAVVADRGAAATADYERGVAVFAMPRGGLMYELSIGGQRFSYLPMMEGDSYGPHASRGQASK